MAVQYNGTYPVTYPDHVDMSTGKTLTVVPGECYEVCAAPGRNPGLPGIPGDGRWGPPLSGPGWAAFEQQLADITQMQSFPEDTGTVPAAEPVTPSPESEA